MIPGFYKKVGSVVIDNGLTTGNTLYQDDYCGQCGRSCQCNRIVIEAAPYRPEIEPIKRSKSYDRPWVAMKQPPRHPR